MTCQLCNGKGGHIGAIGEEEWSEKCDDCHNGNVSEELFLEQLGFVDNCLELESGNCIYINDDGTVSYEDMKMLDEVTEQGMLNLIKAMV